MGFLFGRGFDSRQLHELKTQDVRRKIQESLVLRLTSFVLFRSAGVDVNLQVLIAPRFIPG